MVNYGSQKTRCRAFLREGQSYSKPVLAVGFIHGQHRLFLLTGTRNAFLMSALVVDLRSIRVLVQYSLDPCPERTCEMTTTMKLEVTLEDFVIDITKENPGLQLHQIVMAALEAGFTSHKAGELSTKIRQTVKNLVKKGVYQVDSDICCMCIS